MPMNLEYLDIPFVHKNTPIGKKLMSTLNTTKDLEIFEHSSVQILIDSHLAHWTNIYRLCVIFPATLQLLVFWLWSNVIISDEDFFKLDEKPRSSLVCEFILVTTSTYVILVSLSTAVL